MSDSFATLWTVAHWAPLSTGFPRQEYWSGLPFPSPGDLPDPGIEPTSPVVQALASVILYHCTTWEGIRLLYHKYYYHNLTIYYHNFLVEKTGAKRAEMLVPKFIQPLRDEVRS